MLRRRFPLWQGVLAVVMLGVIGAGGTALAGSSEDKGGAMDRVTRDGDVEAKVVQTVDGKTYVRLDFLNEARATQFGNVPCPAGKEVMGGGVATTSNAQDVNATHPYDAGDLNTAPDDGWRAWVQNNSAADHAVTIHAICLE